MSFHTRLGKCYELAGRKVVEDKEGLLIHGLIRHDDVGDVGHAWVHLDNGNLWEPTTDSTYPPDVFERIFNPIILAGYTQQDTATAAMTTGNWGPWDSDSIRWHDLYHEFSGDEPANHLSASRAATQAVRRSLK